jgi:hypothetical protein
LFCSNITLSTHFYWKAQYYCETTFLKLTGKHKIDEKMVHYFALLTRTRDVIEKKKISWLLFSTNKLAQLRGDLLHLPVSVNVNRLAGSELIAPDQSFT